MEKSEMAKRTREELMEFARKAGLAGRSKMKKDELISSLASLLKGKKTRTAKKGPEKRKVSVKKEEKPPEVKATATGKAESWQEKVEDTKYYLGAAEKAFVTEEELPADYGDNKIVLMVRDPHWAYVYWEINSRRVAEAKKKFRSDFDQSKLILRVYDITGLDFDGKNAHSFFDIDIPNVLGNWYVHLGKPNRTFCIDIGYRGADGGVFVLSRSNKITFPRDTFSEVVDEEWMSSEEEYKNIYAKSYGLGAVGASAELAEMVKRRLEKGISSSAVGKKPKETPGKHQ